MSDTESEEFFPTENQEFFPCWGREFDQFVTAHPDFFSRFQPVRNITTDLNNLTSNRGTRKRRASEGSAVPVRRQRLDSEFRADANVGARRQLNRQREEEIDDPGQGTSAGARSQQNRRREEEIDDPGQGTSTGIRRSFNIKRAPISLQTDGVDVLIRKIAHQQEKKFGLLVSFVLNMPLEYLFFHLQVPFHFKSMRILLALRQLRQSRGRFLKEIDLELSTTYA